MGDYVLPFIIAFIATSLKLTIKFKNIYDINHNKCMLILIGVLIISVTAFERFKF